MQGQSYAPQVGWPMCGKEKDGARQRANGTTIEQGKALDRQTEADHPPQHDPLNARQRRFCAAILQGKSANEAARSAGFSEGYGKLLLQHPRIQAYLDAHRSDAKGLAHTPQDILALYERIAFADVRDFLRFGTRQKGEETVSFVELKDDEEVDGTLIEEIVINAGGVPRIKLMDRYKALEKLERYYDLLPDTWKRAFEEKKLQIAEQEKQPPHVQVITHVPRPEKGEQADADACDCLPADG